MFSHRLASLPPSVQEDMVGPMGEGNPLLDEPLDTSMLALYQRRKNGTERESVPDEYKTEEELEYEAERAHSIRTADVVTAVMEERGSRKAQREVEQARERDSRRRQMEEQDKEDRRADALYRAVQDKVRHQQASVITEHNHRTRADERVRQQDRDRAKQAQDEADKEATAQRLADKGVLICTKKELEELETAEDEVYMRVRPGTFQDRKYAKHSVVEDAKQTHRRYFAGGNAFVTSTAAQEREEVEEQRGARAKTFSHHAMVHTGGVAAAMTTKQLVYKTVTEMDEYQEAVDHQREEELEAHDRRLGKRVTNPSAVQQLYRTIRLRHTTQYPSGRRHNIDGGGNRGEEHTKPHAQNSKQGTVVRPGHRASERVAYEHRKDVFQERKQRQCERDDQAHRDAAQLQVAQERARHGNGNKNGHGNGHGNDTRFVTGHTHRYEHGAEKEQEQDRDRTAVHTQRDLLTRLAKEQQLARRRYTVEKGGRQLYIPPAVRDVEEAWDHAEDVGRARATADRERLEEERWYKGSALHSPSVKHARSMATQRGETQHPGGLLPNHAELQRQRGYTEGWVAQEDEELQRHQKRDRDAQREEASVYNKMRAGVDEHRLRQDGKRLERHVRPLLQNPVHHDANLTVHGNGTGGNGVQSNGTGSNGMGDERGHEQTTRDQDPKQKQKQKQKQEGQHGLTQEDVYSHLRDRVTKDKQRAPLLFVPARVLTNQEYPADRDAEKGADRVRDAAAEEEEQAPALATAAQKRHLLPRYDRRNTMGHDYDVQEHEVLSSHGTRTHATANRDGDTAVSPQNLQRHVTRRVVRDLMHARRNPFVDIGTRTTQSVIARDHAAIDPVAPDLVAYRAAREEQADVERRAAAGPTTVARSIKREQGKHITAAAGARLATLHAMSQQGAEVRKAGEVYDDRDRAHRQGAERAKASGKLRPLINADLRHGRHAHGKAVRALEQGADVVDAEHAYENEMVATEHQSLMLPPRMQKNTGGFVACGFQAANRRTRQRPTGSTRQGVHDRVQHRSMSARLHAIEE